MESTMTNLRIAAANVHDSRRFGVRLDKMISGTTRSETRTASKGFIEISVFIAINSSKANLQ